MLIQYWYKYIYIFDFDSINASYVLIIYEIAFEIIN